MRDLPRAEFAREAAHVLAELNALHPFREGNGRTQRVFLSELADQAGREMHFEVVSRERMTQASIAAMQADAGMMARLLDEITDAARIAPLERAIAFLDSQHFAWNDAYISTATPGEQYSGRLVGRDGDAFMLRSDAGTMVIGNVYDLDPAGRGGQHCSFVATDPYGLESTDQDVLSDSWQESGSGMENAGPDLPEQHDRGTQSQIDDR